MASIRFFDSHIHIYPGSEGRCTKLLDSGHVDGMNLILLSSAYKEAAKLNEEGFALKKKYGKMVQLAYWVNINEKGYMKVMEKAFKEHPDITGVKIHPPGDRKAITEKTYGKVFDFAKERGLYMITHTHPMPGCNAGAFMPIMEKRRDLRFILGHSSPIEESVFMAVAFENVYVEPSWLSHYPLMFDMMGRLFKHKKMLVGTDGPMRFHRWEVDGVKSDVIEEEVSWARKHLPTMREVQAYCYGNAMEFFRIA